MKYRARLAINDRDHAQLRPQQTYVTDAKGGEKLRRFTLAKDDLDLLDRAYCNRADVGHATAARSAVIVRFHRSTLPLCDVHDRPLDIVPKVQRLGRPGRVKSWAVWVQTPQGRVAGRICAVRLSPEATERARAWLRREQDTVTAADLEWAQYMVVFTTATRLTQEQVMDAFRLRWQVELQIKRDKSLGGMDRLPCFRKDTIDSWLSGKLLALALARKLMEPAPFPPEAVHDPDEAVAA